MIRSENAMVSRKLLSAYGGWYDVQWQMRVENEGERDAHYKRVLRVEGGEKDRAAVVSIVGDRFRDARASVRGREGRPGPA